MEKFYTLAEAAEILGLAKDTLRKKLRRRGAQAFPNSRKVENGSWRIPQADIDRWLGVPAQRS